jgi:hypothetical protein
MVFNFDKPEVKDFTETVRILASLSHFVIADITSPRSAPLELQVTLPECMIPFVPIIENGEEPFLQRNAADRLEIRHVGGQAKNHWSSPRLSAGLMIFEVSSAYSSDRPKGPPAGS